MSAFEDSSSNSSENELSSSSDEENSVVEEANAYEGSDGFNNADTTPYEDTTATPGEDGSMCACWPCMAKLCVCLRSVPYMSYATLAGAIIFASVMVTSFDGTKDALMELLDIEEASRGFMTPLLVIILVVDGLICVSSTFTSDVCLKRCCKDDDKCCSLADIGRGTWWGLMWLEFFASYVTVVMSIGTLVFSTMCPVIIGLAVGICTPYYDAKDGEVHQVDLNTLTKMFQEAMEAGNDFIPDKWVIDIPADDMEGVCDKVKAVGDNALALFGCAIIMVLIQVNVTVIARGNLVATATVQRDQDPKYLETNSNNEDEDY